jgi:hypothetical protein
MVKAMHQTLNKSIWQTKVVLQSNAKAVENGQPLTLPTIALQHARRMVRSLLLALYSSLLALLDVFKLLALKKVNGHLQLLPKLASHVCKTVNITVLVLSFGSLTITATAWSRFVSFR